MTSYSAHLDLESALAAPQRCPGCGAAGLVAVPAGEQASFRCASCGQSWHIELGWASPIGQQEAERASETLNRRPVMRIGLIAPPWAPVPPAGYGGTEVVVDNLARGLAGSRP